MTQTSLQPIESDFYSTDAEVIYESSPFTIRSAA